MPATRKTRLANCIGACVGAMRRGSCGVRRPPTGPSTRSRGGHKDSCPATRRGCAGSVAAAPRAGSRPSPARSWTLATNARARSRVKSGKGAERAAAGSLALVDDAGDPPVPEDEGGAARQPQRLPRPQSRREVRREHADVVDADRRAVAVGGVVRDRLPAAAEERRALLGEPPE